MWTQPLPFVERLSSFGGYSAEFTVEPLNMDTLAIGLPGESFEFQGLLLTEQLQQCPGLSGESFEFQGLLLTEQLQQCPGLLWRGFEFQGLLS